MKHFQIVSLQISNLYFILTTLGAYRIRDIMKTEVEEKPLVAISEPYKNRQIMRIYKSKACLHQNISSSNSFNKSFDYLITIK